MIKAKTAKPVEGSRSRSQIIVLFIALIIFIMLLFANFAYLNTQATYDKQYIGHAEVGGTMLNVSRHVGGTNDQQADVGL